MVEEAKVLVIEDDGCNDCPLWYWRTDGSGDNRHCNLSRRTLADGTKLPVLDPDCGPENCPLGQPPYTLKIQIRKTAND